jgi:hypothetical protein
LKGDFGALVRAAAPIKAIDINKIRNTNVRLGRDPVISLTLLPKIRKSFTGFGRNDAKMMASDGLWNSTAKSP